jgi:hypothetical protein
VTRGLAAALVGLALAANGAAAQATRSMTVSRQLHGESRLRASIEFGAGEVAIQPAPAGVLYAVDLTWDRERFQPRVAYDAATTRLTVRLDRTGSNAVRVASGRPPGQRAVVALSAATELDLEASLGAADADVELGGLRLAELRVRTGATRAAVRFSRPNPGACSRAEFGAGAAELHLIRLGDSGCRRVRVEGGVGTITLDLAGAWPEGAEVDVAVTLGGVRLRVPRDVGVRLELDRLAASFKPAGFVREGDAWLSEGYADAARKVALRVSATVGGVQVERVE